jgi:valyl-tRNA synthetase
MIELSSRYDPKTTEDKWYEFWEGKGFFRAHNNPAKKPFCIVIPPPNITGILHMGHALNNTIQDILIRYHRMGGQESLWMPGTDHAGIATQNVVEREIATEGLRRQDLGREEFLKRVWQWREEYGSTIIHQLKKLGASCDWSRARFTMDEQYSRAVREVFVNLWNKGLIYQDNKVINWCPRCQTALSDEEAPYQPLQGNLYYIRYPIRRISKQKPAARKNLKPKTENQQPNFIVVATTRPETMLGDTAVAVHPKDRRYNRLIGQSVTVPLIDREIRIIADEMVDRNFGTGAVKVTPAHDPNDYILGKKHKLEFINIMRPDGRLNANAGIYIDMDRFRAREAILKHLKEKGLLEKTQPHQLSAGHCYRCHTIIEPYLSRQWFVKMRPLAVPALKAVKKGKIKFYPPRWKKVYLNWMENIQDWCISRQIWWGHRIPLWYCLDCKKEVIASVEKPAICRVCKSPNLKQDEDVLDTWFSSWLWPFATFGWPFKQSTVNSQQSAKNNLIARGQKGKTDLDYFYPTSVLVTAPEIIFFWVARMIMAGLEFMKDVPFRDVYIHGTVRDIEGKKMSKSLGNIIDPLEVINSYGADALRFGIISITTCGQDIFLSQERFQWARNFCNKIWNAARFILRNLQSPQTEVDLCVFFAKENLNLFQRWILSRFYSTLQQVSKLLHRYRFNEAANALYQFFWHEFCDWYLELVKPVLINSNTEQLTVDSKRQKEITQIILYKILEKFLRILHPFMPFITEEIWQLLHSDTAQRTVQQESIMVAPWPHIQEQIIDKKLEKQMQLLFEIITGFRNLRAQVNIAPDRKIKGVICVTDSTKQHLIKETSNSIMYLSGLENLDIQPEGIKISNAIHSVFGNVGIFLPLEGILDPEKERQRIEKKLKELNGRLQSKIGRLKNKEFLKRAPKEVIEKEKMGLRELQEAVVRLKQIRNGL